MNPTPNPTPLAAALAGIVPPTRAFKLPSGETVTLTPIKLGQLPGVIKALTPLLGTAGAGFSVMSTPHAYIGALTHHPEALLDVLASATSIPREQIDALDLAQAVELVRHVAELNADFFKTAVQPEIDRLAAILPPMPQPTPPAGPTSSSS